MTDGTLPTIISCNQNSTRGMCMCSRGLLGNGIPMGMGVVFEWAREWEWERKPHRMGVRTVKRYRVPNNSRTFIKFIKSSHFWTTDANFDNFWYQRHIVTCGRCTSTFSVINYFGRILLKSLCYLYEVGRTKLSRRFFGVFAILYHNFSKTAMDRNGNGNDLMGMGWIGNSKNHSRTPLMCSIS